MPSGVFAQFGLAQETTWGTRVAADHWIEARSESMSGSQRFFQSMQIGAGTTFPRSSRFLAVTQDGGGDVTFEVPNKGYGQWLNLLHSATVTPTQQSSSTAYLQTHPIGLTAPTRSATVQIGKPSTDGTVRAFEYPGSMVTAVNWSWALDDALVNTFTFDSQKEDTGQTLATRNLPSNLASFVFTQGVITINGSAVANVSTGNLSLQLNRSTDFYGLDGTGLKQKPIQNAMTVGSGSVRVRFSDLTQYNLYKNNTKPALILDFVGPIISSTFHEELKLTCAVVGFTGSTPVVSGPDVLEFDAPFNILSDGTNAPVSAAYTSVDTAI